MLQDIRHRAIIPTVDGRHMDSTGSGSLGLQCQYKDRNDWSWTTNTNVHYYTTENAPRELHRGSEPCLLTNAYVSPRVHSALPWLMSATPKNHAAKITDEIIGHPGLPSWLEACLCSQELQPFGVAAWPGLWLELLCVHKGLELHSHASASTVCF
jgi:hypothetical protein